MAEKLFLDGKPVTFKISDNLGNGGQADVLQYNGEAVKVWKYVLDDQVKKVKYLLGNRPNYPSRFLFPKKPLTNQNGELKGYSMDLLPDHFREGGVLFNKTVREELKIYTPTMLSVLSTARDDIEMIHKDMIIGDVSGRNYAFVMTRKGPEIYWYDTDSWQVAGIRCPVWTDFFLYPELYDATEKGRVVFSKESDWYSFDVVVFWSIFNSNPYFQPHDKYPEFRDRARRGIWILSPEVQYPFISPPVDVVSDELMDHFEKVLKYHKYEPMPKDLLINYQNSLIECSSCGLYYPNSRRACPKCTIKTPAVDFIPAFRYENLVQVNGKILFAKFQSGSLFVVAEEKSGLYLWIRPGNSKAVKQFIDLDPSGTYRFDVFSGEYLVVNDMDKETLYVTSISSPGADWIVSETSVFSGNRLAAFGGTEKGLLRLIGDKLLVGKLSNKRFLEKPMNVSLSPHQSWFWVDGAGERILTMSRIFSNQHWQLISKENRREVQISDLKERDSLQGTVVLFGSDSICVRRLVNRGGKMIVITDVINSFGESMTVVHQMLDKMPSPNPQNACFDLGLVYWPTDNGIAVEDLEKKKVTYLPKTDKVVEASDKLVRLGGGHFLVVKEKKVNYLVI